MIGQLRGVVASKEIDAVILDVAGTGYEVRLTMRDTAQLKRDDTTTLLIHEAIKEDAHDLYGFITREQKQLFRQLLSVKNVGPRVALAILDIASEAEVRAAIASGNVAFLQTAKGVGKRAAEQIIVELRDKVGLVAGDDAEAVITRSGISRDDEAFQALISLGYSDSDAQQALHGIDQSLPTEERVKLALRQAG